MNWYKHYIGDYQRDTNRLTLREHGVYRSLLDECYATEKPLPSGLPEIYRIVRAIDEEDQAAVRLILDRYFVLLSDGYHNKKADEVIAKAQAQAETNRRIAVQREAKRSNHEPSTNRSTKPSPNQTPDTRHQTQEHSEPIGSGADAPSPPDLIEADPFAIPLNLRRLEPHGDWRKMLFDHGLAFLQNRLGGKPGAHRPLIGKWLAMAGDDAKAVYDALADCEAEGKADPKSWMIARLGGRRPDRSVAAAFEAQRA